jgi:hypothetical protein
MSVMRDFHPFEKRSRYLQVRAALFNGAGPIPYIPARSPLTPPATPAISL